MFKSLYPLISFIFFSLMLKIEKVGMRLVPLSPVTSRPPISYKVLKSPETELGFEVGVFIKGKKKYLKKSLRYRFPHLLCYLLQNEARVLATLQTLPRSQRLLTIPILNHFIYSHGECSIEREYLVGKTIEQTQPHQKIKYFDICLRQLELISQQTSLERTGVRTPLQILLSSGWYLLCLIGKERAQLANIFRVFSIFITNTSFYDLAFPEYHLAHRDLTSQNIFLSKGKPAIIDWETAIWAEPLTDLALFPRYYFQELPISQMTEYLSSQLISPWQKRQFLRLTSYYTLQFLANEAKDSYFYQQALTYQPLLIQQLTPLFRPARRSLYELGSSLMLTGLALLNHLLHFKPIAAVILCYHSVGNFAWRFNTSVADFTAQLEALKKTWRVVPLNALLAGQARQPRVAITFDDGYQNTLTIAAPILKTKHLPATLFALAEPEKAKHEELDNSIPLLTTRDVKKLSRSGWHIGSHTLTHAPLLDLPIPKLMAEISVSRRKLQTLTHQPVDYFSIHEKGR